MANQRVTDLDPIVTLPDSGIIHVIDTTNNAQNAAGSSFKMTKADFLKENTAAILLNTAKVGITTVQATAITNNTLKTSFDSTSSTRLANTNGTNTGDQNLAPYATLASPTFTGTVSGINKTMVGLGSVDNTTDANKPVSTAQATADQVVLNYATTVNNINSKILFFSQALYPDITFNSTTNIFTIVFQSTILYVKDLKTGGLTSKTTFVGATLAARTFTVSAGNLIYFDLTTNVIVSVSANSYVFLDNHLILLLNQRYNVSGQLIDIWNDSQIKKLQTQVNAIPTGRITSASNEYFTVSVNSEKINPNDGFASVSNGNVATSTLYQDFCHFVMPVSTGNPLKLIILCHGGGVKVGASTDAWYDYRGIGNIFTGLGYAVLLTNGMPQQYAIDNSIDDGRQCGNWMSVESAVKAYDYVVNKYNVDIDGCYVYGQSQGGLVAENIYELSGLPIISTILESPAISFKYSQLYIPSALPILQALYGFNSQATYSQNKAIGLDPFVRGLDSEIVITGSSIGTLNANLSTMTNKKFRRDTPMLLIRSIGDTSVSSEVTGAYAKAVINAGGNCRLVTYASGGHSTIATTDIVGSFNGNDIRASLYEMIVFLERCGGYAASQITLV